MGGVMLCMVQSVGLETAFRQYPLIASDQFL